MEEKIGSVYFLRYVGCSDIKIGFSGKESSKKRTGTYNTYSATGVEIIGTIKSIYAKELETRLHLKYAKHRMRGEWFKITLLDVWKEISENFGDLSEKMDWNKVCINEKCRLSPLDKMRRAGATVCRNRATEIKTILINFLSSAGYSIPTEDVVGEFVYTNNLYIEYDKYCESVNETTVPKVSFKMLLLKLGFPECINSYGHRFKVVKQISTCPF